MRFILLAFVCILVVVAAVPLEIDIVEGRGGHLEKRGTDTVIADVVKAALAFGAFIWGGGIISRRAINYYFEKKEELDRAKVAHQLMVAAKVQDPEKLPHTMDGSNSEVV
jgi:hypothetical protein